MSALATPPIGSLPALPIRRPKPSEERRAGKRALLRRGARLAPLLALVALAMAPALAQAPPGPWYVERSVEAGLDGEPAFRVSVGDLNGDGYPDLFVHLEPTHSSGDVLGKQRLYLNTEGAGGQRVFVDATAGSGIDANREGTTEGRHSDAAYFADVDNDGDTDVFTGVYLHRSYDLALGTNELLLNNGDATFTLSPSSSFHTEPNWNTPAAVFLDYDNDSNIDLFIGTWYRPDSTLTVDHLYRGDGAGGFTNVSAEAGIHDATTCVYSVAAFDWDGDGDMDLFSPSYSRTVPFATSLHWRNEGDGTFTQVQGQTNYDPYRGFFQNQVSFGTMPRDFDNDGDIDFAEILTHGTGDGANGVHSTAVANVDGVFSWDFWRVTGRDLEDDDLTHHGDHFASWTDIDHDGLVDLLITESGYDNPGVYAFRQQPDNTFVARTADSGLEEINQNGLSPGYITPADIDRDGDEDLILIAGGTLRYYENVVGTERNYLAIELVGVGAPGFSNTKAIGARVEVSAGGTTQTQEVYAGHGHEGPQAPFTLHFGLGDASVADLVRVRWPNETNSLSELTSVSANQYLRIEEPCDGAEDPTGLLVEKTGADVLLSWDDPNAPSWTYNVYRDPNADPAGWGEAHERGVSDEDAGRSGIQYYDEGARNDGATWFYLVTSANVCGETPLR